jgi:Protein of unknown function (DUF3572)
MRHSSKARQSVSAEYGRSLAALALSFLAADSERIRRFLDMTGLSPQTLHSAAQDPAFLGSVLEYVLADEELLLHFAADSDVEPEIIMRAHLALCGPMHLDDP